MSLDVEVESTYLIIAYFKANGIRYRCELEDTGNKKTFCIINTNSDVKVNSMLVFPQIPIKLDVMESFIGKWLRRKKK